MKRATLITISIAALAAVFAGCSRKGSSSISSGHKSTTTKVSPKVRAQQDADAAKQASLKAAQDAEAAAKAAAEQAAEAARKAKDDAEAAAKAAAQAASEKAVVVKEEKVTIVESKADTDESHKYHIIIGSFKKLANARQLCQEAIEKNFFPSIMENEQGLYRVSVSSYVTEQTARTKIAELRKQYKEYADMWLLIEKR